MYRFIYEYIGGAYDGSGVMLKIKCIAMFTFHMCAGHVLHAHASTRVRICHIDIYIYVCHT